MIATCIVTTKWLNRGESPMKWWLTAILRMNQKWQIYWRGKSTVKNNVINCSFIKFIEMIPNESTSRILKYQELTIFLEILNYPRVRCGTNTVWNGDCKMTRLRWVPHALLLYDEKVEVNATRTYDNTAISRTNQKLTHLLKKRKSPWKRIWYSELHKNIHHN